MNDLIKYTGVILILIGVGILGYYGINHLTSNTPLVSAMGLMIGGMVLHIILNRIYD
jgi:hypothetical protein